MEFYEDGNRDAEDEKVGGDIEDGGGDDLVVVGRTLGVFNGNSPILGYGPAPYGEEKDVDDDVAESAVYGNVFDGFVYFGT